MGHDGATAAFQRLWRGQEKWAEDRSRSRQRVEKVAAAGLAKLEFSQAGFDGNLPTTCQTYKFSVGSIFDQDLC